MTHLAMVIGPVATFLGGYLAGYLTEKRNNRRDVSHTDSPE